MTPETINLTCMIASSISLTHKVSVNPRFVFHIDLPGNHLTALIVPKHILLPGCIATELFTELTTAGKLKTGTRSTTLELDCVINITRTETFILAPTTRSYPSLSRGRLVLVRVQVKELYLARPELLLRISEVRTYIVYQTQTLNLARTA